MGETMVLRLESKAESVMSRNDGSKERQAKKSDMKNIQKNNKRGTNTGGEKSKLVYHRIKRGFMLLKALYKLYNHVQEKNDKKIQIFRSQ